MCKCLIHIFLCGITPLSAGFRELVPNVDTDIFIFVYLLCLLAFVHEIKVRFTAVQKCLNACHFFRNCCVVS